MRVRRSAIAAAAAVVLGTTGALLAPAADIAFALNGGLLDGTLTISRSTGAATGPVTRGGGRQLRRRDRDDHRHVRRQEEGGITITYNTQGTPGPTAGHAGTGR